MTLKILFVEDHADTAEVFARCMTRWGHAVDVAATLADARRMAGECDAYDLLLCDLGLPDGTGCDLMRELAARCGTRGIAITGHGLPADVEAATRAGFAEHLLKPVTIDTLKAVIDREIAHRGGGGGGPIVRGRAG